MKSSAVRTAGTASTVASVGAGKNQTQLSSVGAISKYYYNIVEVLRTYMKASTGVTAGWLVVGALVFPPAAAGLFGQGETPAIMYQDLNHICYFSFDVWCCISCKWSWICDSQPVC